MITEADVAHELHVLDVPDTICRQRLRDETRTASTHTK